jgi:regulator of protease activity HflC (stomatin/prohibitin superfamily)
MLTKNFHRLMITKNFQQLKEEVQSHVDADRVKHGSRNAGFIGCLSNGVDNPAYIEREYGIPLMTSRLVESIFGGLPPDEAPKFVAALPSAIGCDGKDLTLVGWKFLAAELRSLPAVSAETQAVVAPVIAGMDRLAQGFRWPAHEAESASKAAYAAASAYAAAYAAAASADAAAYDAANAAAYAANAAAYAAAYVADAAAATYSDADIIVPRRRQRDTLLQLIKEAPITQEENS